MGAVVIERLLRMVEERGLTPHIHAVFDARDAAAAHVRVVGRRVCASTFIVAVETIIVQRCESHRVTGT